MESNPEHKKHNITQKDKKHNKSREEILKQNKIKERKREKRYIGK